MLFAERGREGAGPARQRKTRGCLLGLDLEAGGAGASLRFASRGATREGPKPGELAPLLPPRIAQQGPDA